MSGIAVLLIGISADQRIFLIIMENNNFINVE